MIDPGREWYLQVMGLFNSRHWNLCAGLALLTGCGSRTIGGADTGESETSASTSATMSSTTVSTDSTEGDECQSDSDCGEWEYCLGGICEYQPHDDGHHPYYECYSNNDCGVLSLCEYGYCAGVSTLSDCEGAEPPAPSLEYAIPEQALALSFVDVDEDGDEELVVASGARLYVIEDGSEQLTTSDREIPSEAIEAMVGGQFDDQAGEDVQLLVGQDLELYSSDGGLGFGSLAMRPSPLVLSKGLLTGDFDDAGLDDLLVWGDGATLEVDAGSLALGTPELEAVSLLPLTAVDAGLALQGADAQLFFSVEGEAQESAAGSLGSAPYRQTAIADLDRVAHVGSSTFDGWTMLESWDVDNPFASRLWALLGGVSSMLSGDLDQDGRTELVLLRDGVLYVAEIPLGNGSERCIRPVLVPQEWVVVEVALGDHDGDGDDDIGLVTADGIATVLDR